MNVPLGHFTQLKQERVFQFLKDHEFGGLLLTRPSNIAWFVGGADVPSSLSGQAAAAILITPEGKKLLSRKADRELLLNSAAPGIGLKQHHCEWPECWRELVKDGLGAENLACDKAFDLCVDASPEVASMRLELSRQELETLRILGVRVARTVEKVAREFCRGDTEAQIAGDIASRLVRHGVLPKRIQVWGDGRGQYCPNWNYGRDPVERYCTISVAGQRQGLHVAVSRTVSFGFPSKELRWTFADMFIAHATGLLALRDQAELANVWTQVERACEKLGCAAEFRETVPGCITGYELCEAPISSTNSQRLLTGMPVIWQSSVGPARAVDTVLVREADCKVITQTDEWPLTRVVIKKARIFGPAVLERSN